MRALAVVYILCLSLAIWLIGERSDWQVKPSSKGRCPSSLSEFRECWLRLKVDTRFHNYPNEQAMLLRSALPKDVPFVSRATYNFLENLKQMDLPLFLGSDEYLRIGSEPKKILYAMHAVNLQIGDHSQLFSSFPGGRDLYQILTSQPKQSESVWSQVEAWVRRNLPGYKVAKVAGTENDGFIDQRDFFAALDNKLILIGNHHDLISHLILFADPRIRALTERVAANFVKTSKIMKSPEFIEGAQLQYKLRQLLNSLWLATQESAPVFYTEADGRRAFALVGGYSSIKVPDYLAREEFKDEHSYHWNLNVSSENNGENADVVIRWLYRVKPEAAARFATRWTTLVRSLSSDPSRNAELTVLNTNGSAYPFPLEEDFAGSVETARPWLEEFDQKIWDFASERASTELEVVFPDDVGSEFFSLNYARLMRIALATEMRQRSAETATPRLFQPQVNSEYVEIWLDLIEEALDLALSQQ